MPISDEFLLQALQNIREDLHAMEARINKRLDEVKPQCQMHAERISELERWRANHTGSTTTLAAVVSLIVTALATMFAKIWRG